MEKIKLGQLCQEVAGDALLQGIQKVKPKYKSLTLDELGERIGLTEFQLNHLLESALGNAISEKLEERMEEILQERNQLIVPNQFVVFPYESKVRKNDKGEALCTLSVRTRKAMKHALN